MKIRIYMKNGTVFPDFECDKFTTQTSNITGDLEGYKFVGGIIPRPMFLDLNEVLAIWRVDDEKS